jgi:hypothetical protein
MVGTSIDRGIDNGCICIKGDMKGCEMVCGDGRGGRGRADVVGGGEMLWLMGVNVGEGRWAVGVDFIWNMGCEFRF